MSAVTNVTKNANKRVCNGMVACFVVKRKCLTGPCMIPSISSVSQCTTLIRILSSFLQNSKLLKCTHMSN